MTFNKLLSDIRFWIVLFFVIRLIGITSPPLDEHNWRQSTVAMVARNFVEVDNNIFYPRIDVSGEKSGITGMEFPLLNYLIYILSEVFGYQHWYGRLINLLISSFGIWFFYRLLKKYFTKQIAFNATIILAVSVWFQFSKKMMPDTFAMSFIIASLYFGSNYLDTKFRNNNLLNLLTYFILMTLGILAKLPAGFILIIFGPFYVNKNITVKRKVTFAFVTALGIMPVIVWYFYWGPHLIEKYDFNYFFMGKSFEEGFHEIKMRIPQTLWRFYHTALGYIGFLTFLSGLIYAIIKKEKLILTLFFSTFICFCIVILKAGNIFIIHNYYMIPFVPIMAFISGFILTKIRYSKIAMVLLLVISIESLSNQSYGFSEIKMNVLTLEKDLDKVSHQSDLIAINCLLNPNPTPLYFSHRKGWVLKNEKIKDEKNIRELKRKGLKYIVILKRGFSTEIKLNHYKKILENDDYCIYDVETINSEGQ